VSHRTSKCGFEFFDSIKRFHPFTPIRFHVLFNSLFKVLFNFPSRYLFAIGLATVFSLGWSLPPVLGLRSQATRLSGQKKTQNGEVARGLTPAMGSPIQENLDRPNYDKDCPLHHNSLPESQEGFGDGLFLVHSPLLKESWLVSFPPLSYMLKFSG
jgi:hypothetical protein